MGGWPGFVQKEDHHPIFVRKNTILRYRLKKKQFLAKHEVFVHFSSVFSRNLPRAPTTSGPHQRAWLALDQAAVEVCLHPAISGKSYAAILAIES
jgi:cold shock CspA family protein